MGFEVWIIGGIGMGHAPVILRQRETVRIACCPANTASGVPVCAEHEGNWSRGVNSTFSDVVRAQSATWFTPLAC